MTISPARTAEKQNSAYGSASRGLSRRGAARTVDQDQWEGSATARTVRRYLVVAGCVGLVSCSAGSGSGVRGGATVPRPQPAETADPAPLASPGGRGPAITYAPVENASYTFHRLDSLILHLPGGAIQRQSLERTAFLRLTIVEAAANSYRATIVLDSLRAVASAVPILPDSLAPLRGTRWTATVTSTGQLSNLVADRSTTLGDQLASHLRLLFPTLPAGGAKAGTQWSDTTSFPLKADAFDATEYSQTTYHATEDRQGIKIDMRGTYRRNGTEQRPNDRLDMVTTGRREGVIYLSRDSQLLSARGLDAGKMTITVPSVGQTVPVDQSGRYEIRPTGR